MGTGTSKTRSQSPFFRRFGLVSKVVYIDSARMVLHIRHGKGQKERLTPMSPWFLEVLRSCWREYRPATWLFTGVQSALALTDGTVQRICKRTARRTGLPCRQWRSPTWRRLRRPTTDLSALRQ